MKKGFIVSLATGLTVAGLSAVLANSQIQAILNDGIKVTLNGQVQEFKDETTNETQYPITYHDRTYLPLRTVANLVGVDVDYDASSNTAMLNNSNKANFKDNFSNQDYNEYGKFFSLAYKATLIEENAFSVNNDTIGIYWYFQKNELVVDGGQDNPIFYTIKFGDKIIKDVCDYNKSGLIGYSIKHVGESAEVDSGLIILFEDGTVGNITVSDLMKGSNNITLFDNVSNVEWLCEGGKLQTDSGKRLFGINGDGYVVFSYEIEAGV